MPVETDSLRNAAEISPEFYNEKSKRDRVREPKNPLTSQVSPDERMTRWASSATISLRQSEISGARR